MDIHHIQRLSRRRLLSAVLPAVVAATAVPRFVQGESRDEKLSPVRAITRGPKRHWFGYYDKLQFDPGGRYGWWPRGWSIPKARGSCPRTSSRVLGDASTRFLHEKISIRVFAALVTRDRAEVVSPSDLER